jgi:hypothetical protein
MREENPSERQEVSLLKPIKPVKKARELALQDRTNPQPQNDVPDKENLK